MLSVDFKDTIIIIIIIIVMSNFYLNCSQNTKISLIIFPFNKNIAQMFITIIDIYRILKLKEKLNSTLYLIEQKKKKKNLPINSSFELICAK